MALLSVLMPVYDCDQFVQAAIDSILNQTFRDFEFIIIDDGSKDRTAEIVEAAAARDPRIRVISRENRGIVPSLNEALEQATGTLVARMDGDDISLPDRFSRQVAYLQKIRSAVSSGPRSCSWIRTVARSHRCQTLWVTMRSLPG